MTRSAALSVLVYIMFILAVRDACALQNVQANFVVSPLPVAGPSFRKGVSDVRASPSLFAGNGEGIAFSGAGFDSIVRSPFSDRIAADLQVGLFGILGRTDSVSVIGGNATSVRSDLMIGDLLVSANAELQIRSSERSSFILFGGPILSLRLGTVDSAITMTGPLFAYTESGTLYGSFYGVRGGGSLGITIGDYVVGVSASVHGQRGRQRISWSLSGDSSTTVPSVLSIACGLDILYRPWGVSLGVTGQSTGAAEGYEKYSVLMGQAHWSF